MSIKTLLANMRQAVRNRETVSIGGGSFTADELRVAVNALEACEAQRTLQRMWIDQPSTLQQFHEMHGTNVLAYREYGNTMRVYFLSGDVVSQQIPSFALSDGWLDR